MYAPLFFYDITTPKYIITTTVSKVGKFQTKTVKKINKKN